MTHRDDEKDVGVPEAVGLALRLIQREIGASMMDRLWIFPPLTRGRKERGLLAVSCFVLSRDEGSEGPPIDSSGGGDPGAAGSPPDGSPPADRRRLHTVAWAAERTGTGVTFDPLFREEGSAPSELLPRVIDGVVRRSGLDSGSPREVRIAGKHAVFEALLTELELPEVSAT